MARKKEDAESSQSALSDALQLDADVATDVAADVATDVPPLPFDPLATPATPDVTDTAPPADMMDESMAQVPWVMALEDAWNNMKSKLSGSIDPKKLISEFMKEVRNIQKEAIATERGEAPSFAQGIEGGLNALPMGSPNNIPLGVPQGVPPLPDTPLV